MIDKCDADGDGVCHPIDYETLRSHYTIDDRENKTNKDTDPAIYEVGDTVTYYIKITNNNTNNNAGSIKITEITDTYEYNWKDDSHYKRLVYDENTGVSIIGDEENKAQISAIDNSGKLNITISNPVLIAPGESITIRVKFKIDVGFDWTDTVQTLQNTATITGVKNKNDVEIIKYDPITPETIKINHDLDGTGNNTDSDWVKTEIYAVSIEKYVMKGVPMR